MFAPQLKVTKPKAASHASQAPGPRVPDRPGQCHASPPLIIGRVDDPLEQEADRIADQVLGIPAPAPFLSPGPPMIRRKCACGGECSEGTQEQGDPERLWMKRSGLQEVAAGEAAGIVQDVLRTSGQPLDEASRAYFEPRFRRDLGAVRVHSGTMAAQAAQSVGAQAYTVGHHVVFGAGRFSPQTSQGRRLLAHELAHVGQQTTSRWSLPVLQRTPDERLKAQDDPPKPRDDKTKLQKPKPKPGGRRDVILLGEGWKGGKELGTVLSPDGVIIPVKSVANAAAELAKIQYPIGTLYFVTHSTPAGELKFGKDEGYVKPDDIAARLKGSVSTDTAPGKVDFRGCSVGTSPTAMEQIRMALEAQSVVAGTCFAVIQLTTPIKIGDKEITKASDVTENNRETFRSLFNRTATKLGPKKKNCIVSRSEKSFFAVGGRFVVLWFNPDLSSEWLPGKSVCYNAVKPENVDPTKALAAIAGCRLIRVEATGTGAQEGKSDIKETKP